MLPDNIIGISPLRCEPVKPGMMYTSPGAVDKMWSDPRAINAKNWLDTESADLVLAYLPKEMNDRRPSIGTIIEIGWTLGLKKPLIVATKCRISATRDRLQASRLDHSWMLLRANSAFRKSFGSRLQYISAT